MTDLKYLCVALAGVVLLDACGARSDASGSAAKITPIVDSTGRHPDSSATTPVSTVAGAATPVGAATHPSGSDTARVRPSRADSGPPPPALEGRSKQDNASLSAAVRAGQRMMDLWPKGPPAIGQALFPAKRIVAFYGNPLSKQMGVLGEYPVEQMLAKLDTVVAQWNAADPATPVQPALHLIAVVAQGTAGRDGKWRTRMDTTLINKVYDWAQRKNAILFLDIQVAQSHLQDEIPRLLPYLSRPNVHLGVDPEFSMHYDREGLAPGKKIGTMDAADINYAIQTLAKVAADNHLPPKILVVHRFTAKMVTNAAKIQLDPHVQVVMNMDGWGPPWLKFDSYRAYVVGEPVQYAGFKVFFHNDTKKGDRVLSPAELMRLKPAPLYIQYQ